MFRSRGGSKRIQIIYSKLKVLRCLTLNIGIMEYIYPICDVFFTIDMHLERENIDGSF